MIQSALICTRWNKLQAHTCGIQAQRQREKRGGMGGCIQWLRSCSYHFYCGATSILFFESLLSYVGDLVRWKEQRGASETTKPKDPHTSLREK